MTLVVIRFLFGLAEGPYPSAALKQISEEYDKSDRSQATSVTISSNYAGAAIAPLIIVPIIASHGWRVSFYFLGILGLILVGLYYLIERPIKSKKETTTAKKLIGVKSIREYGSL